MAKKVEITNITPNETPVYLKTLLVEATRDGVPFTWEMVKSHNSVHIMVDNIETKEILFVKQIRIPVLANNPGSDGFVIECAAGLVDKDCSIAQIAKEEILEELGYNIPLDYFTHLRTFYGSVGSKGNIVHCYSVEVTEEFKENEGGGLDDEDIEVIRIPYNEIDSFVYGINEHKDIPTDSTTLFLLIEWLYRKNKKQSS